MKLGINHITAKLKSLSSNRKMVKKDFVNPYQHWIMGLSVATIIFIGSVIFIVVDFYIQFELPQEDIAVDVKQVRYRDKDVLDYAQIYNEREIVFNRLRADKRYVPPVETIEDTASSTDGVSEEENTEDKVNVED